MEKSNIMIGARPLSKDEARKLLPTLDSMLDQVRYLCTNQGKDIKNYDNVFSILGPRGSGKTSILNTIMKEFEDDEEIDCISLPIISPNEMLKGDNPIGWVISAFEKTISKMEQNYIDASARKPKNANGCVRNNKSDLMCSLEKLIDQYEKSKDSYENIIQSQYRGRTEFISDNKERLFTNPELQTNFEDFIDKLILARKNTDYMGNDVVVDKESMVFIYFDDFDLEPKRCVSVLKLIESFFKNKNVLVFVGGDYEQFLENTTINLLKEDNILDYDLLRVNYRTTGEFETMTRKDAKNEVTSSTQNANTGRKTEIIASDNSYNYLSNRNALEYRKSLAKDFLKKILPPALRSNLVSYTNEDKLNFYVDEKNKNNTLGKLIKEKFGIDLSLDENYAYLDLFDKHPRGLINCYYYLVNETKKRSYSSSKKKTNTLELALNFFDILINSNNELLEERGFIKSIFIIDNSNRTFYINHYKINSEAQLKPNMSKLFMNIIKYCLFYKEVLEDCKYTENKLYSEFTNGNNYISLLYMTSIENTYGVPCVPNTCDTQFIFKFDTMLRKKNENLTMMMNINTDSNSLGSYFDILNSLEFNDLIEPTSFIDRYNFLYKKYKRWVENIFNFLPKYIPIGEQILKTQYEYYKKTFSDDLKVFINFNIDDLISIYTKEPNKNSNVFIKTKYEQNKKVIAKINKIYSDVIIYNFSKRDFDMPKLDNTAKFINQINEILIDLSNVDNFDRIKDIQYDRAHYTLNNLANNLEIKVDGRTKAYASIFVPYFDQIFASIANYYQNKNFADYYISEFEEDKKILTENLKPLETFSLRSSAATNKIKKLILDVFFNIYFVKLLGKDIEIRNETINEKLTANPNLIDGGYKFRIDLTNEYYQYLKDNNNSLDGNQFLKWCNENNIL